MINKVAPGAMPPLPAGFAAKFTAETSGSDDPRTFVSKSELLRNYQEQRAGTLAALSHSATDQSRPKNDIWQKLPAMRRSTPLRD